MGGGNYRVKYIPDPKSFLQYTDAGGVVRQTQDGILTKRILKSTGVSLVASYGPDELIKANFTVISFNAIILSTTVSVTGNKLNPKVLSEIDRLEGGEALTIKNIKAVGPDGKIRTLSPIAIQI